MEELLSPDNSRRRFLLGGGALIGATALLGACENDDEATAASSSDPTDDDFDPTDWSSVRAQFELDPDYIHMAGFVLASHPRPVRAAIERYREEQDRNTYAYIGENELPLEDAVRAAAARYLGVSDQEIALTDSTTMGLALLYGGMKLGPGDEMLATTHDFYSTHESIRLSAERSGASFRKVPLFSDPSTATVDEIVGSVRAALKPETRVFAVTWVHSSTGMKLPISEIAAAVEDANHGRAEEERILLCVDAVHGFGNQDVDLMDLGCDFLVSGCHKWLFGPRGTGFIWGRLDAWARVSPTIPTFSPAGIIAWIDGLDGPADQTPSAIQTPGGFHSFEHRWALKEAFEFHEAIGRDRVAERTAALAAQLKEGLASISGINLVTPMGAELSGGVVCFEVDGQDPPAVVQALMRLRRIVASVTPYREQYVRLGPSIVTSEEEVDETLRVLRSLT